jgi:hypothetical protein
MSISTLYKSLFFADARPPQELPLWKLPETERVTNGNAYGRFVRAKARSHVQLTAQPAEVQVKQENKPT